MPSRRTLLLSGISVVVVALASPLAAAAADSSAHDFVAAIYDSYVGKDRNGLALDSDAKVRRYFEPSLAALIVQDRKRAARRGEVGTLTSIRSSTGKTGRSAIWPSRWRIPAPAGRAPR